jgi:hypothetical protein
MEKFWWSLNGPHRPTDRPTEAQYIQQYYSLLLFVENLKISFKSFL